MKMVGHFSGFNTPVGHFSFTKISTVIQRYFTQRDPVAQSYDELAIPIILVGDFEIELDVLTTDTTTGMMLFSGGTSTGGFELYKTSTGSLSVWYSGSSKGGTGFNIADGELHTIKLVRTSTSIGVLVDNDLKTTATNVSGDCIIKVLFRRDGDSFYFDGILSNLKTTDKSGAEDVPTTFALDKPPAEALYEYGDELVVNGGFENGDYWTKTNVTISDGVASFTALNAVIAQPINVINGQMVSVSYEVVSNTSNGQLYLSAGGFGDVSQVIPDNVGIHTILVPVLNATNPLRVFLGGGYTTGTLEIDNISVQEITNYAEVQATKNIELALGSSFEEELVDLNDGTLKTAASVVGDSVVISNNSAVYSGDYIVTISVAPNTTYYVSILKAGMNAYAELQTRNSSNQYLGNIPFGFISTGADVASLTLKLSRTVADSNAAIFYGISIREIQGNALTRINVADEDTELFEKSGNQWDNISPLPQELPDVIQIAEQS